MISRTHEKALARVARLKEKEKELNRLKTHYGKDYKQYLKLKKNVVPSVMPPSKHMSQRKIGIQRKVTDISEMKKIVSPPSREDISQLLSYPLVQVVANSSTNKKADYISGIYIGHLTSIADFLLIVEGNNKPHLQALVDDIEVSNLIHLDSNSFLFGLLLEKYQVLRYQTAFDSRESI